MRHKRHQLFRVSNPVITISVTSFAWFRYRFHLVWSQDSPADFFGTQTGYIRLIWCGCGEYVEMSGKPVANIDLSIVGCIFLSVLSHFLPPWADVILSIAIVFWNLSIALKYNFNVPNWFKLLLVVQIMNLVSGFYTDHDPLDGEWGGKSEPNEWL